MSTIFCVIRQYVCNADKYWMLGFNVEIMLLLSFALRGFWARWMRPCIVLGDPETPLENRLSLFSLLFFLCLSICYFATIICWYLKAFFLITYSILPLFSTEKRGASPYWKWGWGLWFRFCTAGRCQISWSCPLSLLLAVCERRWRYALSF